MNFETPKFCDFENLNVAPVKIAVGQTATAGVDSVLMSAGLARALAFTLREQMKFSVEMMKAIEDIFIGMELEKDEQKEIFMVMGALNTVRAMYENSLNQIGVDKIERLF